MGSVGNQNPWAPYNTYRDCSQGICSIYCPQWCYIIFPPPPPFGLGEDDSGTDFSPLIIAIIGILASAFILVSYYTIISKYCRRRSGQGDGSIEMNGMENEAWHGSPGGLEEALIKSITVCMYKKGDGFIEGTDCSVCLSEFQENENLRLLPNCNHAFHLPCIDTWLKSHASCPLCRANIAPTNILPGQAQAPAPIQDPSRSTTVSTLEYQHSFNDAILVIQDLDGSVRQEAIVSISVVWDDFPKTTEEGIPSSPGSDSIHPIRRSVSMNFSSFQNHVSISDILRISEDGIADQPTRERENNSGIFNLVPRVAAMKKSASTGRIMFPRHDKGWGSVNANPV